jgi:hypothetical protein
VDPEKIDVVAADAPANVEPLNQADEVRNDVAEAIKSLKTKATVPSDDIQADAVKDGILVDGHPAPIEDKGDHPSDPKRYADGTFKPVKQEAAPEKAAAPETKLPPVDNTAKPSTEQPSTAVGAAPVSWAAEAKASWASLSPVIQNAVLKREAEVSNGFRQKSEEVRRYEQVIAPVAQEAARLGMQPDQAINALMSAHHALQQNPSAAIARLAQQYGVDLATLASNPPAIQEQARPDPMVSQLTQHVSKLESQLSGFLQNQTLGVVEKFASEHPHYAAVEEDIARLIPIVQQTNPGLPAHEVLSKAYEQAIWVNPDVRAKLISEQAVQTQQSKTEAIKVKSSQAQKAAVSIKGSSNGAAAGKMPPPSGGDVYDDVRAAIQSLRQ